MRAKLTAAKIVKAYAEGGADAVTSLCESLSDDALRGLLNGLDGRASAPWKQTSPGARYARCGTCGDIHHFGLATTAHSAKHARERGARRILEGETLRRRERAAKAVLS